MEICTLNLKSDSESFSDLGIRMAKQQAKANIQILNFPTHSHISTDGLFQEQHNLLVAEDRKLNLKKTIILVNSCLSTRSLWT